MNSFILLMVKSFTDISDLEDLSRYSHAQRRAFAEHIIYKFGVSSPCKLDDSDFINPFAQQVARIFNGHMTCIFFVGERQTTLCLSGSLKIISFNQSVEYDMPLCACHIHHTGCLKCGSLKYYGSFKNQLKSYLE